MNFVGNQSPARLETDEIHCANFNQDNSCISVGTKKGYKIYNCDPFGKCYQKLDSGMGLVEMLFCTSLVALVGYGDNPKLSPRKLQIINTKRQSIICELTFANTILAVRLNRKRLVVALAEHIYIYDIGNMKLLHTIDVSVALAQTCALSPSSEHCYLAYPVSAGPRSDARRSIGSAEAIESPSSPFPAQSASSFTSFPNVAQEKSAQMSVSAFASGKSASDLLLFDAINLAPVALFSAHKSPLVCVNFNIDGTLVATASDKGTVIRVFSAPGGEKLWQFRRGTLPATIHCLSFNIKSTLLAASSDSETVHIFKLDSRTRHQKNDNSRRSTLSSITGYILPDMVQQMYEPERDFARAKLRLTGRPSMFSKAKLIGEASAADPEEPVAKSAVRTICAISSSTSQLMVATSEGYFYQFSIDTINGGDCIPLNQYSLLDSDESSK